MNIVACEQGSDAWKKLRAGNVTASRIADVLAKIKTGEAAARRDYKAQLVAEILTGEPQENGYTNGAMQWGTEQEPFARGAYEVHSGEMVDQVGLVLHPTIKRSAASPDGLVGKDGLVEIKCPKTATHLQYILAGVVPTDYQPQMLWQMACTGRQWCDFVSYDPRLPAHLQLFVVRYLRDEKRIIEIELSVGEFIREVEEMLAKLGERDA